MTLLLSEDKGRTWKPVRTAILPDDDFAAAGRLNPNQLYAFKLLVKEVIIRENQILLGSIPVCRILRRQE